MTQVITWCQAHAVIQVADRKLTLLNGSQHDTVANKTIVFVTEDAIATLGYTGLAYLGDLPSDEWLVQVLLQRSITRGPDGVRPSAVCMGNYPLGTLDDVVKRLKIAIDGIEQRLVDKGTFEIVVAGFRATDRDYRATAFWKRIRRGRGEAKAEVTGAKKRGSFAKVDQHMPSWTSDRSLAHARYLTLGAAVTDDDRHSDRAKLVQCQNVGSSVDVLTERVRTTAANDQTVGANLMCVVIDWSTQTVEIRLDAEAPHTTTFLGPNSAPVEIEISYSPWILAPTGVFAPMVSNNDTSIPCGEWAVLVRAAGQANAGISLMSSARRQGPPSSRGSPTVRQEFKVPTFDPPPSET